MENSQYPKIRLETKVPRLVPKKVTTKVKQLYKPPPNKQLILKMYILSFRYHIFKVFLQLFKNN